MDSFAFELGYHMSYGLVVCAIGILFSIIVPYLAMLSMVFFLFKYYVDKYNLSFVYNSEFQGQGSIKKWVVPLTVLILILFQLITVGLFASKKIGKHTVIAGTIFILVEIVCLIIVKYGTKYQIRRKHIKSRKNVYFGSISVFD